MEEIKSEIIKLKNSDGRSKRLGVIAAVTAAVALIVAAAVFAALGSGDKPEEPVTWSSCELTSDLPGFPAEATESVFAQDYAAAYYSGVTGEQIADYIRLLNEMKGIDLAGDRYPRSAEIGDGRTLIIQYNVTEREFSLTVAKSGSAESSITEKEGE